MLLQDPGWAGDPAGATERVRRASSRTMPRGGRAACPDSRACTSTSSRTATRRGPAPRRPSGPATPGKPHEVFRRAARGPRHGGAGIPCAAADLSGPALVARPPRRSKCRTRRRPSGSSSCRRGRPHGLRRSGWPAGGRVRAPRSSGASTTRGSGASLPPGRGLRIRSRDVRAQGPSLRCARIHRRGSTDRVRRAARVPRRRPSSPSDQVLGRAARRRSSRGASSTARRRGSRGPRLRGAGHDVDVEPLRRLRLQGPAASRASSWRSPLAAICQARVPRGPVSSPGAFASCRPVRLEARPVTRLVRSLWAHRGPDPGAPAASPRPGRVAPGRRPIGDARRRARPRPGRDDWTKPSPSTRGCSRRTRRTSRRGRSARGSSAGSIGPRRRFGTTIASWR